MFVFLGVLILTLCHFCVSDASADWYKLQEAKPQQKPKIALSKLRCNWTPAETAKLKESIGRKTPNKIDYQFALLNLPGRSPSGIYRRCLTQNLFGDKPKAEGRQHTRRVAAAYAASVPSASMSHMNEYEDDYVTGDDTIKMLELWGDGMQMAQISSALGVAQNTIYRRLKRMRESKDIHMNNMYRQALSRRGSERKRSRADDDDDDDDDLDAPAVKRSRIDSSDRTFQLASILQLLLS